MTSENWGGHRKGAGRPSMGRAKVNFYITEDEKEVLKSSLDEMRNGVENKSKIQKLYSNYLLNIAINQKDESPIKILDREGYGAVKALGILLGKTDGQVAAEIRQKIIDEQCNPHHD